MLSLGIRLVFCIFYFYFYFFLEVVCSVFEVIELGLSILFVLDELCEESEVIHVNIMLDMYSNESIIVWLDRRF